jgi:hypothetical protein
MSHYGTTVQIQTTTDAEWLGVGSKIGRLVNDWAGRSDLVAYVGERAGQEAGAPASFNPHTCEIEVNVEAAFGDATPDEVDDLTERMQQYEFPKAVGAIYHEAMHARFSTWKLEDAARTLTPAEFRWMHLLEESRIERLGVLLNPRNRVFLRACALEIVLADMKVSDVAKLSSIRQAAHALGLTYARVDAGVLDMDDIEPVLELVSPLIASEILSVLRGIWIEFQGLHASETERMYQLARDWEAALKEASGGEEEGEGESGEGGQSGEGGSGEPSDTSTEGGGSFAKALIDAIEDAMLSTELSVTDAIYDEQTKDDYERQAESVNTERQERDAHSEVAKQVFGNGHSGPEASRSSSTLLETRTATSEERVSAVRIAKSLEKAKYHDRIRTVGSSDVPPGRLRTRALVQGQALKAKNIHANVEPFKRIKRHHTQDPELTIGVMVDISGSMGTAMKPMASAAWILSESVRRIQGKAAMVYYGSDVFATLKPGQHLEKVNVYSAPDGTEKFDKGFRALDGTLNLLHGSGARLLVVVSDGEYTYGEDAAVNKWLKRCQRAGVGVLWIGAGAYGKRAARHCKDSLAVFTQMKESATGVADEIGRRAAEALEKAGAGR